MASEPLRHPPTFCPIENRAIPKQDRLYGAACPFCGVPLPAKNRVMLVTVDDAGAVVSSELEPKPPVWKRTSTLLVVAVVVLLIGVMAVNVITGGSGSGSSGGVFVADVTGYSPVNPATLEVTLRVRNVGSKAGQWECTVRATDDSGAYSGWEIFSDDATLAPGGTTSGVGSLTITNEGAAYVTEVTADCRRQ